ncbi:pseudouridine synthase [Testicularia cyperi]|uniref:Pseudouridine synthase n=1 Tax=Testicularia cyperi TaxID=1882483 RepID=A0A317XL62_9BASI|nr:pseudouridine synthase [Testicularia cyperi]
MSADSAAAESSRQAGLRKTEPYWFEFQTYAKQRWFGRELIEIMTTEFRDRTKEYYVWAIHKGICSVNGKKANIHQVISDGDQICNSVHRHEPPVTNDPIKIIHRDDDKGMLVIVKPGSIPVHAAGRYLKHTLTGLLESQHGIQRVYTTNRLDRLTSGVMVCSTKKETASKLGALFASGQVSKAYVCRVRGQFPEGEVACREPILTIDRQSGVNIVHPKGKPCETIFVRLSYDAETDTSVVFCRPITGRTHQIRVHVQYLGHPISNDPIYGHNIWDKVDPASFAEVVPDQWKKVGGEIGHKDVERIVDAIKGDQDGQEDWARWKDEVLFKDLIKQEGLENVNVPGPNGRSSRPSDELLKRALEKLENASGEEIARGLNRPVDIETAWQKRVREQSSDFCPECKIPLLPDPKPEELYIYLHAIKYWSDEWTFEDTLPWWAREDWKSITPSGSGSLSGAGEASLPQDLAVAHKTEAQLSSMPMSALITNEIEEKAARLVDPQKYTEQDHGLEILQVSQLVDRPPVASGVSSVLQREEALLVEQKVRLALHSAMVEVPVVFQVFGGFEDFAQRELAQQIIKRTNAAASSSAKITASIHAGHVWVRDPVLSTPALQAYLEAQLGISKAAYLLTALEAFPQDLAAELKHEKYIGGTSKRAKYRAKELKKAIARGRGRALGTQKTNSRIIEKPALLQQADEQDGDSAAAPSSSERNGVEGSADQLNNLSLTDDGSSTPRSSNFENSADASDVEAEEGGMITVFASEVKLLDLLDRIWNDSTEKLDKALQSWIKVMEAATGEALKPEQLSYRATVDRATYNLPSLTSQSMERHVGNLAWLWLNGPDDETADLSVPPKWKVDLEQPLLDVTLKFFPGFGIADEFEKELDAKHDPSLKSEGQIAFMLKLPSPFVVHPRRPAGRNALLVGGTTMAEYRAASLALSLPLPTQRRSKDGLQQAETLAPFRVLEPCCGHGSLAFETAAMMEAKGLHGEVLGCDIEEETVSRAQKIASLANLTRADAPVQVHLKAVDGTKPEALEEFVGGRGTIDAIITDLPWGKREKAAQSLSKLYSYFLESWFPVLRTGGYAMVVTAEHRTLTNAITIFETVCRKKRRGAILKMEEVRMLSHSSDGVGTDPSLAPLVHIEDEKVKTQGQIDVERNGKMRKIEIGYHVYVFMIRKMAL